MLIHERAASAEAQASVLILVLERVQRHRHRRVVGAAWTVTVRVTLTPP